MKISVSVALFVFASVFAATGCIASSDGTNSKQASQMLKSHKLGMPDAKVKIDVYEDLTCPFTRQLHPRLVQLMQAHPMDVNLTFHHYPLSFEKAAMPAAEAVECAAEVGDEGAFWDMHESVIAVPDSCNGDLDIDFVRMAKDIGLDVTRFTTCLESGKYWAPIQSAHDAAYDQGIDGSPTTVINGTVVAGAVSYERLEEAFNAAFQVR